MYKPFRVSCAGREMTQAIPTRHSRGLSNDISMTIFYDANKKFDIYRTLEIPGSKNQLTPPIQLKMNQIGRHQTPSTTYENMIVFYLRLGLE